MSGFYFTTQGRLAVLMHVEDIDGGSILLVMVRSCFGGATHTGLTTFSDLHGQWYFANAPWNFTYHDNTQTFIFNICFMIYKKLLATESVKLRMSFACVVGTAVDPNPLSIATTPWTA